MKTFKIFFMSAALMVLLSHCSNSNNDEQPEALLIAHYPLTSDAIDVTGRNDAMTLVNTPFEDGGIYVNGIYRYSSDPNYSTAESPDLFSLNFKSFSISADFKVQENRNQPVFVVGASCRVIGFYLTEFGTVDLLYNNWDHLSTETSYALNTWHNAKISFDGTTAKLFYDDKLAGSLKFGDGYVPLNFESCRDDDTKILVTNYSSGQNLKGYIKNLQVYSPQ